MSFYVTVTPIRGRTGRKIGYWARGAATGGWSHHFVETAYGCAMRAESAVMIPCGEEPDSSRKVLSKENLDPHLELYMMKGIWSKFTGEFARMHSLTLRHVLSLPKHSENDV